MLSKSYKNGGLDIYDQQPNIMISDHVLKFASDLFLMLQMQIILRNLKSIMHLSPKWSLHQKKEEKSFLWPLIPYHEREEKMRSANIWFISQHLSFCY
jgi:hypothetical protein